MICPTVFDVWQRCAGPTAAFLFEELVRKPWWVVRQALLVLTFVAVVVWPVVDPCRWHHFVQLA
jgi:hypothetical protein